MVNFGYLVFLIITKLSFIYGQSQLYSSKVELKNWCYMNENKSSINTNENEQSEFNCPGDGDHIDLHFKTGNINGSMIVEFPLAAPHCPQITYQIELLFYKLNHENKTCSGISSPKSHSEKEYSILTCNGNCTDVCGKNGSVQFFNVYPGCYNANIRQFIIPDHFIDFQTNWVYFEGSESEPWDTRIDIEDIIFSSEEMDINMTFSKPTSYVILKLINGKTTKIMNMSKLLENKGCHFSKSEADSGNITKYDGLSCSFSKNFSRILVHVFKDDQCDEKMKNDEEKKACWKLKLQEIHHPSMKDRITMERSDNSVLLGIIGSSFLLVTVVGYILFQRLLVKRKSRSFPSKGEYAHIVQDSTNSDYEILLLYAKDCKEFMVTMESFRQMLGELCNVKVYDCFDEPCWENDLMSPHDWLEKIMKFKPSLHIILVSTLSACIQHQGFLSGALNGKVSAFKDPSCMDKIFLYGLRIVKDYEISTSAYGKIFIIQLNGFSDDTNSKELSSLSRVYQIPLHLNLLVRDMKNASSRKNFHKDEDFEHPRIEITPEKNSTELSDLTRGESYNKFLQDLEVLKKFKMNNQNYLINMLQPIS